MNGLLIFGAGLTGGIILLIIFLVIVLIMIGIAIFGTSQDKKKRLIRSAEMGDLSEKADVEIRDLWIMLRIVNDFVEVETNNGDGGRYTLAEMNTLAIDKMKEAMGKVDMEAILSAPYNKELIKPLTDTLSKTKPSNWNKSAHFYQNLIIGKSDAYISEDKKHFNKIKKEFTIKY